MFRNVFHQYLLTSQQKRFPKEVWTWYLRYDTQLRELRRCLQNLFLMHRIFFQIHCWTNVRSRKQCGCISQVPLVLQGCNYAQIYWSSGGIWIIYRISLRSKINPRALHLSCHDPLPECNTCKKKIRSYVVGIEVRRKFFLNFYFVVLYAMKGKK